MRVAYYCQHVLGVGHFHRSLQICRAFAKRHTVTMISGGEGVGVTDTSVPIFQLPGLMMDTTFKNLASVDNTRDTEEVRNERKLLLQQLFKRFAPDIFLVELYPFGRKAFRFELDPLLQDIKDGEYSSCLSFCSLRDILVERNDPEKFENRIISTLNTLFDGVLIHSDKRFIRLDDTFSRRKDIRVPLAYTGYVTPAPRQGSRGIIRKRLRLPEQAKLIVASIGGGSVGHELLLQIAASFKYIHDKNHFLQIFTGPYCAVDVLQRLKTFENDHLKIQRFTENFPDWLAAADLSVSMAGYNTCMNILAAGTPALLYPFRQNQEQNMRIEKLAAMVPFTILEPEDLEETRLASHVAAQLKTMRYISPLDLQGADNTVQQIEHWHSTLRSP